MCTRGGIGLASKKNEKKDITEEAEEIFQTKNLLRPSSSQALLNTVYPYNGKLFGLRSAEHGHITLNNFVTEDNFYHVQGECFEDVSWNVD